MDISTITPLDIMECYRATRAYPLCTHCRRPVESVQIQREVRPDRKQGWDPKRPEEDYTGFTVLTIKCHGQKSVTRHRG